MKLFKISPVTLCLLLILTTVSGQTIISGKTLLGELLNNKHKVNKIEKTDQYMPSTLIERYFFGISSKLPANLPLQKCSPYLTGYTCAFCILAFLSILNLLLKKYRSIMVQVIPSSSGNLVKGKN